MAHQVELSWNADPDALSGYNIYHGTVAGAESTTPINGATPVTGTTYTDTTAVQLGPNFYVIRAVANGVDSPVSNEVSAVILPAAPTGLTVVAAS